jgi:hypothetical protein
MALSTGFGAGLMGLPRLGLFVFTGEDSQQPAQCRSMASRAESLGHPDGGPGAQGSVPENLASIGVAQVRPDLPRPRNRGGWDEPDAWESGAAS